GPEILEDRLPQRLNAGFLRLEDSGLASRFDKALEQHSRRGASARQSGEVELQLRLEQFKCLLTLSKRPNEQGIQLRWFETRPTRQQGCAAFFGGLDGCSGRREVGQYTRDARSQECDDRSIGSFGAVSGGADRGAYNQVASSDRHR